MIILENPMRRASFTRCSNRLTSRSSPTSPISPTHAVSARTVTSTKLLTSAMATVKLDVDDELFLEFAVSKLPSVMPPTTLTYTSLPRNTTCNTRPGTDHFLRRETQSAVFVGVG